VTANFSRLSEHIIWCSKSRHEYLNLHSTKAHLRTTSFKNIFSRSTKRERITLRTICCVGSNSSYPSTHSSYTTCF
jgi:hypothetical protein